MECKVKYKNKENVTFLQYFSNNCMENLKWQVVSGR